MRIPRQPLLRVLVDISDVRAGSRRSASFILGVLALVGAIVSVSAATISGTIAYSGGQTGMIVVTASTSSNGVPVGATTQIASPGAFTLTSLPAGTNYWLFAYRDSNTNGTNDSPEARTYSTNALFVSADVSGVTLSLLDPDSDGDGLPDWWEIKFGFDPLDHGMDGDLLVAAGETRYVDSVKSAVIGTNAAGATNLFLTHTNGFRANDSILIIAMQDTNQNLAQNIAGTYEVQQVLSVGSNGLTLRRPLTNSFTSSDGRRIQVLKIPDYRTAQIDGTLTCSSWDGTNGGILAFICVSGVTIGSSGLIVADGKGYRGGIVMGPDFAGYGVAGEGTTGRPVSRATDRVQTQQGGGGAGERVGPGGGGGNGTAGTELSSYDGSANGQGAQAFGSTNFSRIYMGGGGGGSGSSASEPNPLIVNVLNYFPTGAGGAGGGIILVATRTLNGTGLISSVGLAGEDGRSGLSSFTSGAGGGAGGSIYIAGMLNGAVRSAAGGGVGGRNMADARGRAGGVGGLGRLRVDTSGNPNFSNMTPQPGYVGSLNKDAVLPVATDADGDGVSDYDEFLRGTNPTKADTDGDGLLDAWEVQYGLNPSNPADALSFPVVAGVTNKLTYLQIYQLGLDPTKLDYDNDELKDYDEIFLHGTDAKNPDTDGDGLPDGWEVLYGLNPRLNDASESKSFDGVTNLQKYQWNQAHTNEWEKMYPNRAFSGTNTVSDYERFTGSRTSRPVYDRNDRLIGVEYSSGVSLAYVYDGNGNLVRQKWISRASETNGLPALFSFLNSLTNSIGSGPYDDPDGDGWTNWQEQKAGTNPNARESFPRIPQSGTTLAIVTNGLSTSRFVVATGDLDQFPGDEIVVGSLADSGPTTNWITVLSSAAGGWVQERISVGDWGVASLAVAQQPNGSNSAIYAALSKPGRNALIKEFLKTEGQWRETLISVSSNELAEVFGSTGDHGLILGLSLSNSLYSVVIARTEPTTTNWTVHPLSDYDGIAYSGASGTVPSKQSRRAAVRLLKSGQIEVVARPLERYKGDFLLPTNVVQNPDGTKLYFQTPGPVNWRDAQAYGRQFGGDLVHVQDATENAFLLSNSTPASVDAFWIGLHLTNNIPNMPANFFDWRWITGQSLAFAPWGYQQPKKNTIDPFNFPFAAWVAKVTEHAGGQIYPPGTWNTSFEGSSFVGVLQIAAPWETFTNSWILPPGAAFSGSHATTRAVTTVQMQSPGSNSTATVFLSYVDDANSSQRLDRGDYLTIEEFLLTTNAWSKGRVIRQALIGRPVSDHRGIAALGQDANAERTLVAAGPEGYLHIYRMGGSNGYTSAILAEAAPDEVWHRLSPITTVEGREGLLALSVVSSRSNECRLHLLLPGTDLSLVAEQPQTAPSVAIHSSAITGGSLAQVSVRLWDNEGSVSLPMLEFLPLGGSTWSNATLLSVDGQTVGRVTALPTGSDHVLLWNAGRDLGAGFTNTVLLRARASDVTLTGDYSSTVSYRVEVSAGNPVANPDSTNTLQEVPVDIQVLANDTVQNGRTLSIAAYTQPANGTVGQNANQTLRYTPRTNFLGTDSFNYTISDGTGGTNIAVVTVNVLAVNHPPTPQSYAFTTVEDSPVSFAWNNDRDGDGDLVTLLSVRSPSTAGGLVTLSGGVITYAPPPNFFGTDTFTFIVQDNGLTSGLPDPKQATNTVTITVTPVNDSPVIAAVTNLLLLNEDAGLLFTGLSVSDPDAANSVLLANLSVTNGVLTLGTTNGIAFQADGTNGTSNLVLQATLADLNAALTNLSYQGVTNFNGSDRLLITLDDQGNTGAGGRLRTTNVVWLTVNPVNDLPTAAITNLTNGQAFLTKDNILIQAEVRDLDSQIIRVDFLAGTNVIGSLTNAPYAVTFTNPPAATNLALTVRATDDQGGVGVSPAVNITVRLPGLILLSPPVVSASRSVQLLLNNPDIGRQFRLEYSTDLKVWTAIGVASNTNGTLEFNHTVPTNETSRFYRAVLLTQ